MRHPEPRAKGPRLELAPASERGWFGGRSLVATDAISVVAEATLAEAADALQAVFDGVDPGLVAVLASYDGACTIVRFAEVATNEEPELVPVPDLVGPLLEDATWDLSPRAFRAAVNDVRSRIAAGDVYVLNLTARLSGKLRDELCDAGGVVASRAFGVLRRRASSDMDALFEHLPGSVPWIASVSPERFLRVTRDRFGERRAEICPIKGTVARGADPDSDRANAARLQCDAKELAEHVMVVDLERNDLGRCCVSGTVKVEPLYEVVATPYCHQLVSTVSGRLHAEATVRDLLESAFPCGSITGAPKHATRAIISELEASGRGAYCGALIVGMRDEIDSSVLIRTLEGAADDTGRALWGAGCGVTYDSDPVAEHLELLLKASPVTGDAGPDVALRETMRVSEGQVRLLDLHLARLASGGAGPTVLSRVRGEVGRLLSTDAAGGSYARIGVTVTPDGAVAAGVTTDGSSLTVAGGPIVVPVIVDELPALPKGAAKPAVRRWWDRAHSKARLHGGHQALIVTTDGALVDGSTANVWLRHGDVLSTPPAPPAIAGVAREFVFDHASAAGLKAIERALTVSDLESADEVWLSNAVGGVVRARGVLRVR